MWIILTYDIDEKRVQAIRKICLPYLKWLQNSVFIGDITKANLSILISKLENKINDEKDSIQIFVLRDEDLAKRITIGISKEFSNII
ncbi:MAG: CRISPR-associated endonuclease Cas2 [Candidatus Thermoplasmatota archaeon]|nr:CRISPR-associated endonuclease Cas2 [Candidatus Thermoplasmatota archaeon]